MQTATRPAASGGDVGTLGRRALAAVVDHALVALLASVALVPLALFARADTSLLAGVGTVVWFGYFSVLETLAGQTPGKRALGVTVVTEDGDRPDAAAAVGRTLFRVVDWLPAGYLLGVVVLVAGGDGRRVGDRLAGTRVVRTPSADDEAPGGTADPFGADGTTQ